MKKKLTLVVSLLLVMALSIGGTLAYLTAKTTAVTNTFTIGNIKINLKETTTGDYKIVPGATVKKDPTITVEKGSEKCYVYAFINNALILGEDETAEVVATPDVNTEKWIAVKTDVLGKSLYRYYEKVDAASAEQPLPVFENVTYNGTAITADNISKLDTKTIVIDAFAHQSENIGEGTKIADDAAIAYFFPTEG